MNRSVEGVDHEESDTSANSGRDAVSDPNEERNISSDPREREVKENSYGEDESQEVDMENEIGPRQIEYEDRDNVPHGPGSVERGNEHHPSQLSNQHCETDIAGEEDDNDQDYAPEAEHDSGSDSGQAQNEMPFVWKISRFSEVLQDGPERKYSENFRAGDNICRVLLFPRGNVQAHQGPTNFLSVYVEVIDIPSEGLYGTFKFKVINHRDESNSVVRDGCHTFTKQENDRGFAKLINLEDVRNPSQGFLIDDTLELHTIINVKPVDPLDKPPRFLYDSKKETGFVGLKNQGATCYMNSLLQFMYHIPRLREAVYNMETEGAKSGTALALQRVFYHLQTSHSSVETKQLTHSFGWNSMDSFLQHDVQEFNRLLCDSLEEKMKGTKVDGMIAELFKGKLENFIECINVDYKSTRIESFYDLSLMVKNCSNLWESFKQYVEVETLEGDNQYRAEGHGKQDARKGCRFVSFPPVMHLHLKRFEYDMMQMAMVKLNDRFEFPTQIDLDEFVHRGANPKQSNEMREENATSMDVTTEEDGSKQESEKNKAHDIANDDDSTNVADGNNKEKKPAHSTKLVKATPKDVGDNVYLLHSVLVHSGSVHGGHYFAYIRPCPRLLTEQEPKKKVHGRTQYDDAGRWYRFDDEEVRSVPRGLAVDDNFGGMEEIRRHRDGQHPHNLRKERARASSAYMLVYINYKETLYHPRVEELTAKTLAKLKEFKEQCEKKKMEAQENDRKEPHLDKDGKQHTDFRMESGKEEKEGNEEKEQKEQKRPMEYNETPSAPEVSPHENQFEREGNSENISVDRKGVNPIERNEMDSPNDKDSQTEVGKERPGEKRKRRQLDYNVKRPRKRTTLTPLELADETNEEAEIVVPGHLVEKFKAEEIERKEEEERRRKAHLFHDISILSETSLFKVPKLGIELRPFKEIQSSGESGQNTDRSVLQNPSIGRYNLRDRKHCNVEDEEVTRTIKMLKDNTLHHNKKEVSETFEMPEDELEYWIYSDRENCTKRPNRIIHNKSMKNRKISTLVTESAKRPRSYRFDRAGFPPPLDLFLRQRQHSDAPFPSEEQKSAMTSEATAQPQRSMEGASQNRSEQDAILLLFKFFDIENQCFRYVGSGVFLKSQKCESMHPVLRKMANLKENAELVLFEEENAKNNTINPCEPNRSLRELRLLSGDIICFNEKSQKGPEFQKQGTDNPSLPAGSAESETKAKILSQTNQDVPDQKDVSDSKEYLDPAAADEPRIPPPVRYNDAREYLEYLIRRYCGSFRAKDDLEDPKKQFNLELMRSYSEGNIRALVARQLGCDANKIRVQKIQTHTHEPGFYDPSFYWVYEKLRYSLSDLKDNFALSVRWLLPSLDAEELEVLIPKSSSIGDLKQIVVAEAKQKFPAQFNDMEILDDPSKFCRLVAIKRQNITAIPKDEDSVRKYMPDESHSNHRLTVDYFRGELIPEEEKKMSPNDVRVCVVFCFAVHYGGGGQRIFHDGMEPFFLVIKNGEVLGDLRARLKQKLKSKRLGPFKLKRILNVETDNSEEINDDEDLCKMDWRSCQLGIELDSKYGQPLSFHDRPMRIMAS